MNVCVTKNHVWIKINKKFSGWKQENHQLSFFLDICKCIIHYYPVYNSEHVEVNSVQCYCTFCPYSNIKSTNTTVCAIVSELEVDNWTLQCTYIVEKIMSPLSSVQFQCKRKNNAYWEIAHSHFNGPTASLQAIDPTNTVKLNVFLCYLGNQLLLHTRHCKMA